MQKHGYCTESDEKAMNLVTPSRSTWLCSGLGPGQAILYSALSLLLVLLVSFVFLLLYYRPSIEFAFVDVNDFREARWWNLGLMAVCISVTAVGVARLVRRRKGGPRV